MITASFAGVLVDYIPIHDGTNAQLGIPARLIAQIKKELGIDRVLEKCTHCGQWGAVMCACPHCGAPIDPR